MRFPAVLPCALSPFLGTDSSHRVQLFVGVPPAGTVAVIIAAFSAGIASEPLKSVQAARDRPGAPVRNVWVAFPVPATESYDTSWPEPAPSSIGQ